MTTGIVIGKARETIIYKKTKWSIAFKATWLAFNVCNDCT